MNIYMLELVGKWLGFAAVSLISFFGNFSFNQETYASGNLNSDKSLSIVHEIIPYKTKLVFKNNIPANVKYVAEEGIDGIVTRDEEEKIVQTFQEVKDEVVYYGNAEVGSYSGKMTGYGPDCKTCNGKGIVACPKPGRVWHSLVSDGVYYDDPQYGEVRILAATKEIFRCGTIIEVTNKGEKFMGIVLDRGSAMENAYANGQILIDLAFHSELESRSEILGTTSYNVGFNVKRWGF